MNLNKKTFIRKSFFATSANLVSMATSVLLSLVMPKFVSVEEYGYWQMFILYSGFVGFIHLGLCDGLYLYWGGKSLGDINSKELHPIFTIYQLFLQIVALFVIVRSVFLDVTILEKVIWGCIGLYMYIANTTTFFSMILLAVNEIEKYSKAMMIARFVLLLIVSILLVIPIPHKLFFVITTYICTHIIEMCLLGKNFNFKYKLNNINSCISNNWKLIKKLIGIGFVLMLSNITANLILGTGRIMVQYFWNIEAFAKLSFAVSLSMFFIAFLSSISYVIFPILRNTDQNNMARIIHPADHIIGFLMMVIMLSIVPLKIAVAKFLPSYVDSILFAVYMLPACLYLSKTQMLYNAFFKCMYMQKSLFVINIITLIIAVILYYICAVNKDIEALAFSMMIACALRYYIMKIYSDVIMKSHSYQCEIVELVYIIFYIVFYSRIPGVSFIMIGLLFCSVYAFKIYPFVKQVLK